MSDTELTPVLQRFIEYFGALGPRWGLDKDACRVHAYLYLSARPTSAEDIAAALSLSQDVAANALRYLVDYKMLQPTTDGRWRVEGDPWDMLMGGLEERRRREIGPALETLRQCRDMASADQSGDRAVAFRIGKLLALVEDLAALDAQTRRLSPRFLKGVVGVSGRLARLADRTFGPGRRGT